MKLAIIGSGRVGSAFATASATRTSQGLRCAARTQRAAPQRTGMTLAQEGASAAEQLAELLPNASVVTAFISISCVLIRTPRLGRQADRFHLCRRRERETEGRVSRARHQPKYRFRATFSPAPRSRRRIRRLSP
jgi:hypothetical protein